MIHRVEIEQPTNTFIGGLSSGRELFLKSVKHDRKIVSNTMQMADGSTRTQWGRRARSFYSCNSEGLELSQIDFLNFYRQSKKYIWFIDSVAYEYNAMPYRYSCPDAGFGDLVGFNQGDEHAFIVHDVFTGEELADGTLLSSYALTQTSTTEIEVPNFRGQACNISYYSMDDGTISSSSASGVMNRTYIDGSWSRVDYAIESTPDTTSLNFTLGHNSTIGGLQITWGSTELKPYVDGLGVSTGIIGDMTVSSTQRVQGKLLTPVSFDIEEEVI